MSDTGDGSMSNGMIYVSPGIVDIVVRDNVFVSRDNEELVRVGPTSVSISGAFIMPVDEAARAGVIALTTHQPRWLRRLIVRVASCLLRLASWRSP